MASPKLSPMAWRILGWMRHTEPAYSPASMYATARDTANNSIENIGLDSLSYWMDVINVIKQASAANVKALMNKHLKALAELV